MVEGGECQSAYFHKMVNMRRRINTIHSLDLGDRVISDEGEIRHQTYSHFKKIFGKKTGVRFSLLSDSWDNSVDLSSLDRDFIEEDIKKTVWDLGADRAWGLDGFLMFFFS